MKNLKVLILTLVISLLAGILGGAVFIFSGAYNVAASKPHNKLTLWIIDEMRERALELLERGRAP